MTFFSQITEYFLVYKKYIGRRLYIVFLLSALAAIMEGFGIAMLLPLMAATDVGMGGDMLKKSEVTEALQSMLQWMGIGSSMVAIVLFIALMFLVKGGILFMAYAYQAHLESHLLREIKTLMFDKYSTMDYRYYTKHNTGHFINIINMQIGGLISSFTNYKHFLTMAISTTVYLGTAFLISWSFALIAMIAGLIILVIFRGLNNHVHNLSRKTSQEKSVLSKFLVQSIQSFKYLASTAEFEHLRNGVIRSLGRLSRYAKSQGVANALTQSLTEPIAIFFILLIIIIQVSVLEAPLAPIFVAVILFNRAMVSIMGVQQARQGMLCKIGALEIVEKEFMRLEMNQEPEGKREIEPLSEHLVLQNVTFSYNQKHEDILKELSVTIPARQTVAFVGKSGAGKSTLVDILTLILRPREGELLIDGVPGSEVLLHSWRQQIGYVSQETVVFDDTIANNICLWKEDYQNDVGAKEHIEEAARQSYANQFILDLPKGYNTVVGDRGVRLSGGQRQRLFLARELYKQPRLLILDEATSALDSESEQYIKRSIDALRGQTTVVIIAHRLSSIKDVDCIYVLDKGRIVETGTFSQLIKSENGYFSRMVESQNLAS